MGGPVLRPLVRVGFPVRDLPSGPRLMGDWLEATCTGCGLLGTGEKSRRPRLIDRAARHARDVHDDDVDREGWT